jgi:hypothetical protein
MKTNRNLLRIAKSVHDRKVTSMNTCTIESHGLKKHLMKCFK